MKGNRRVSTPTSFLADTRALSQVPISNNSYSPSLDLPEENAADAFDKSSEWLKNNGSFFSNIFMEKAEEN